LYAYLGTDLLRRGEYEKAIDLLSLSVYLQQRHMATPERNPAWLNVRRSDLLGRLNRLGNAYWRAGRLEESAEQYQRAVDYIKEWGVKYPWEAHLYGSMGEIHFQRKNFPEALENFQKVLALGESRQMAGDITRAARRIGDILRSLENQLRLSLTTRGRSNGLSQRVLFWIQRNTGSRISRVGWASTIA